MKLFSSMLCPLFIMYSFVPLREIRHAFAKLFKSLIFQKILRGSEAVCIHINARTCLC